MRLCDKAKIKCPKREREGEKNANAHVVSCSQESRQMVSVMQTYDIYNRKRQEMSHIMCIFFALLLLLLLLHSDFDLSIFMLGPHDALLVCRYCDRHLSLCVIGRDDVSPILSSPLRNEEREPSKGKKITIGHVIADVVVFVAKKDVRQSLAGYKASHNKSVCHIDSERGRLCVLCNL